MKRKHRSKTVEAICSYLFFFGLLTVVYVGLPVALWFLLKPIAPSPMVRGFAIASSWTMTFALGWKVWRLLTK